ncbi:hypothetical protein Tco_0458024 [Tanacetum coccineum]
MTLKPLLKIDPKDKGKKKIEEEDESDTKFEGIPEAEKKFKQLARDEEMARKVQEDWEAEEEVKKLAEEEAIKTALSNEYDFIQARIEVDKLLALRLQHEEREQFTVEERAKFLHDTIAAQRRFDESFTAVGYTEDEIRIKEMNEGVKDPDQKSLKKRVVEETPKKEDTANVPSKVDVTEQGTMDSEIMERKSVIAKLNKVISPDGDYLVIYRANGNFRAFNCLLEVLHIFDRQDLFHRYDLVMEQYSEITLEGIELILWMLDLRLEVERESTVALDLIRFIKQQIDEN